MSEVVPTFNRRGYQSATTSPLLQEWLSSYDGEHPLLDVGCAYGINTLKALEKGFHTFAMDPEKQHLDILRENVDIKFLTCVLGSAPYKFSANMFSGILSSEVLHLMGGKGIENSFQSFYEQLIPHGKLVITTLSNLYLRYIDKNSQTKFYQDLAAGVKWPGIVQMDEHYMTNLKRIIKSDKIKSEVTSVMPDYLHFCTVKQIVGELELNGFNILHTKLGEHAGHMDREGVGALQCRNVQIVAEKI